MKRHNIRPAFHLRNCQGRSSTGRISVESLRIIRGGKGLTVNDVSRVSRVENTIELAATVTTPWGRQETNGRQVRKGILQQSTEYNSRQERSEETYQSEIYMAIVMEMTWERWDAALDLSDSKRHCCSASSVPVQGIQNAATEKAVSEAKPRPGLDILSTMLAVYACARHR